MTKRQKTKRKKIEAGIYRTERGTYEAFDRDPSGKRISKTWKRLAEARDWRAEMRESRNRGTYVDQRRGRTSFKDYAFDWLETKAHRSPRTYTDYLGNIENHLTFFHDMPIGAIERHHIERWLAKAHKLSGDAVVRKAFQTLSAILKRAEMNRDIPRTPVVGFTVDDVPAPDAREITPPTPEDVCRLASTIAPRYRVMVFSVASSAFERASARLSTSMISIWIADRLLSLGAQQRFRGRWLSDWAWKTPT